MFHFKGSVRQFLGLSCILLPRFSTHFLSRVLIVALTSVFTLSYGALADVSHLQISALGGVSLSDGATYPAIQTSIGASGGGGLLIHADFSDLLGAETGALYMGQTISETVSSVTTQFHYESLMVPAWLSLRLNSSFSFHVGGFTTLFPSGSISNKISSRSNPVNADLGMIGGLSGFYPLSSALRVRLSALYGLGLGDLDGVPGISINSRTIYLLTGLVFGL